MAGLRKRGKRSRVVVDGVGGTGTHKDVFSVL